MELMDLLYFFESIRTPVLNIIGEVISFFGSETFLLILMGIIFWCVDKELGYKMAFSYVVAGTVNNVLKLALRISRPWVRDTSFSAVESARSTATGYSFPSGHANNIGVIGTSLIMNTRYTWLKIVALVMMIMVPISRMYLGVHTIFDVIAGLGLGILITIIVNKVMSGTSTDTRSLSPIMFALMLFPLALIIVALAFYYNGYVEYENMADAVKSSGAFFGIIIGWYIERTKVHFNVRCSRYWKQILKLLLGFAVVFIIKVGLKELFLLIGEEFWPGDFIRYFLMTFFAIGIYPMIIKKLFSSKIGYDRI